MARSAKTVAKRKILPDAVYNSRLLEKLINRIMFSGKKSTARKQVYLAMEILKKNNPDPLKTFETAINMVGPRMEVRPKRVGGASYQVPVEVKGERRIALAIRWITASAKKRSNKEYHTYAEKLAAEITDALKGLGESIKKRDTVQRMADANRAFAHFRW
ncbi:MAG: 30S ribosomal protein S7 [Candidatus Gottesmanbacteria bacterium GW2011_GWA1_34_13]|uniref:Small ribosomal subunit protein uS7 n=1 Tax=Candidatus Gottesmanbacteria bacterium GW2011_GWA1_34_13 TaxID=1618434 RepID=A0A0G0ASC7_9BACT|nr:MAG: 30S ribosomal protein S7 [Candidatus Gottesmanbacteria bacterium GW2011_GWA1_34_13]